MTTKGTETEQAAGALYEQADYEVYIPPKAKWREQDVFGLFDLLAVGHGQMVGAQVKTNRVRQLADWMEQATVYAEMVEGLRVEYAVLYEGEGWKIYRPDESGYTVAYDGREIHRTPAPIIADEVLRP